ncbi:hypothetical protein OIO90_001986 [Microbotryomycetes sp. JL221]|nr:hypothetical protein OIO90_001986 [Microbotryomycetes sp. JL221]
MSGPKYPSTVAPQGYYDGLAERIRQNLLPGLQPFLSEAHNVLELGSGTGVHAALYVQDNSNLNSLQPTEADEYLVGQCRQNAQSSSEQATGPTIRDPVVLDVLDEQNWVALKDKTTHTDRYDLVLINNCLHMIPFPKGSAMIFKHLNDITTSGAVFLASGPFKSDNDYFSESDRQFDEMIKARPQANELGIGLRSIDALDRLAKEHDWTLTERRSIPKGNFVLVFKRNL